MTADRIAEITSQVEESEGSLPGVDSTGFELFFDEAQETAVFVAYFKTEQKLRDASKVFEDMEPSETPGPRASEDLCEVKLQRPFSGVPTHPSLADGGLRCGLRESGAESLLDGSISLGSMRSELRMLN